MTAMSVAQAQQLHPKRLSRVLIVDDHSTFADLLSLALNVESDFDCVGTAPDIGQAVAAARRVPPGMGLMDIQPRGGGGPGAPRPTPGIPPGGVLVVGAAHPDPNRGGRA